MTKRTYQIREAHFVDGTQDGVFIEVVYDAETPQYIASYADADEARSANAGLDWREITDYDREIEEISGDILYQAEVDN